MSASSQDVPHVEKRADHIIYRSFSCVGMLTTHKPVKSNTLPMNKKMHMVRMYCKWKRKQTTLIAQIILLCWNANHACYTPGRGKIVPCNITLLVGEKLFRVITLLVGEKLCRVM